ncbi:MAG: FKBP-type peptidyl-prolyl cis-trans isomerase [Candidatus Didemnitutus sp.]|nr:FKBP-type peptidyl-prolyl cis-trans isomerase [Candidatus Didemnitutus sp.]
MKFTSQLSAGVASLGLLLAATAQAQNPVKFELPQVGAGAQTPAAQTAPANATAPAAAPAAPAVTYTETQIMEAYGWMLAARGNFAGQEFTPAQIDAMAKGMTEAAQGKDLTYDGKQMGEQLQAFLAKKQQVLLGKIREANRLNTAEFFTKLKENKAVKELAGSNGLRYEVLKEGKGQIAKDGQIAKIHLIGAFTNGQIFESTLQQQQGGGIPEPVDMLVKSGTNAPEGLILALKNMPVGAKWRLYVPPHLAYGDDGAPGIQPAATLLFEVEVFGVADAPAEQPAAK